MTPVTWSPASSVWPTTSVQAVGTAGTGVPLGAGVGDGDAVEGTGPEAPGVPAGADGAVDGDATTAGADADPPDGVGDSGAVGEQALTTSPRTTRLTTRFMRLAPSAT